MRRTYMLSLLAASTLTLVGCTGVSVSENSKPATQKGAFFSTRSDIETTGDAGFKNETRVVVPAFRVGFVQAKGSKASASGGLGSSGTASTSANTTLHGVDDAVYQAITDAAYADFIADLKANGYEVLDKNTYEGLPVYQSMAASPSPQKVDSSAFGEVLFYAPKGMKVTFIPGEEGGFSGFKGFDSNSTIKAFPQIGKELKASVIAASYIVDYVNTESSGGFFASRASVEIGQGLSLRPGSGVTFYGLEASGCVGYCPHVVSTVKLGQAVYSQEKFGELKDMQTDGEKAAQSALRVVTALTTGSAYGWATYEMHANPADYKRITTKLMDDSNGQIAAAMAKLR
jgi:hypothetical protein